MPPLGGTANHGSNLWNSMKLDPVDKCFIVDGTSMSGPSSKGFKICFAGTANVVLIDGGERDQVDGVHLDLRRTDRVTASLFDLGPPPEPEGHGDAARYHLVAQVTELSPGGVLGRSEALSRAARLGDVIVVDRHAVASFA